MLDPALSPRELALSSPSATTTDLTPHRLVVLPASLNENTHTYDGIDVCAERVVKEIDLEIKRVEEDGGIVRRFSIVG